MNYLKMSTIVDQNIQRHPEQPVQKKVPDGNAMF